MMQLYIYLIFDLRNLIVVENEKLVGIISRKDLLKAALNRKKYRKNTC